MKTRIVLTLDLSEQDQKDLRYLLTDALAEFRSARQPAEEYVERRYDKRCPPLSYLGVGAKIAEVNRRCDLAARLKSAAHQYELEFCPSSKEEE